MAGLERGAVYVPGYRRDGKAVAGPDEDAFTLAATALEILATVSNGSPSPTSVHLIGTFPPVVEWGMAAFLGHPVELVHHAAGPEGLLEAVAAMHSSGPSHPALLVAVDLSDSPGEAPMAVALRYAPSAVSSPVPVGRTEGAAAAARELVGTLPTASRAEETSALRRPPPSESAIRAWHKTSLETLSEGAYVPRARYLENLPSRWRLEAERCARCAFLTFPARGRCRSCGAEEGLSTESLPREGARVVAATTIGKGGQPTEFDAQVEALGEYSVVLAEFAPDVRLTLQVTDAAPGEVSIGAPIGTRLRRLYPMEGEWRYGRKAVPLSTSGTPSSGP